MSVGLTQKYRSYKNYLRLVFMDTHTVDKIPNNKDINTLGKKNI